MQRDMPQRYWKHLPEAREIDPLLRDGARRLEESLNAPATAELMRASRAVSRSLQDIAVSPDSLMACRRCELWRHATQAVPGEGPEHARIMLIGEQPGDEEDLRGRPFVGPAGRLLDEILAASGLDRSELFITNAVKHFKWEPRGKRRLHRRPDVQEIRACGPWLDREIASVAPRVIVALGSTALRAVTGLSLKIEEARETVLRHSLGASVVCSYHPSAILRAQDEHKSHLLRALEHDLRRAARMISTPEAHDPICETAGDT
jgi:DNA polymerase